MEPDPRIAATLMAEAEAVRSAHSRLVDRINAAVADGYTIDPQVFADAFAATSGIEKESGMLAGAEASGFCCGKFATTNRADETVQLIDTRYPRKR